MFAPFAARRPTRESSTTTQLQHTQRSMIAVSIWNVCKACTCTTVTNTTTTPPPQLSLLDSNLLVDMSKVTCVHNQVAHTTTRMTHIASILLCRYAANSLSGGVVDHGVGLLLRHVVAGDNHIQLAQSLWTHHSIYQLHKAFFCRCGAYSNLIARSKV